MARRLTVLTIAFHLVAVGCGQDVQLMDDGGGGGMDAGTGGADGGDPGDGSMAIDATDPLDGRASDLVATRDGYCMGAGPPLLVGDGEMVTEGECGGRLASRLFRFALCTCTSASVQDRLIIDSFDSSMGPFMTGESGGSVGVNTRYENTNITNIGGSLFVAGTTRVQMSSTQDIGGDVELNGPLTVDDRVRITRDAYVNGNVDGSAAFIVGRDLYLSPGSSATGDIRVTGATNTDAAFTIDPPCACGADDLVDIAAIVAAGAATHHNEEVGIGAGDLQGAGGGVDMELPCGRFYFDTIETRSRPITLRVDGRTLIYVAGDVTVENPLNVIVGPMGELDLFIAGNLEATDALNLGDGTSRPASVRLYVGGTRPILMSSGTTLAGNLYAPFAQLRPADRVTIFGSAFVESFASSGDVTIHYDRAVITADEDCPDIPGPMPDGGVPSDGGVPPPGCMTCGDCPATEACVDGVCGDCRTDGDCCRPLVCNTATGRCETFM